MYSPRLKLNTALAEKSKTPTIFRPKPRIFRNENSFEGTLEHKTPTSAPEKLTYTHIDIRRDVQTLNGRA